MRGMLCYGLIYMLVFYLTLLFYSLTPIQIVYAITYSHLFWTDQTDCPGKVYHH